MYYRPMSNISVGVLPGGLKSVLQLEQGVGDDQPILRAESEEAKTIFIELTNTVLPKHILP